MNKIKRGQIKPRAKTIEIQNKRNELVKKQHRANTEVIERVKEANKKNKEKNRIKNEVNENAKEVVSIINVHKKKYIKSKVVKNISNTLNTNTSKILMIGLISILGLTVLMKVLTYNIELPHIASIPSTQSTIEISMNKKDNSLDYNIVELAIQNKKENYFGLNNTDWLKSSIDTSTKEYKIGENTYKVSNKTYLKQLKINRDFIYLEYANKEDTASKELILAKEESNTLNTNDMKRINRRFKEKSNPIQVKTKANSYENMFIMLTETLAGGKLDITSLKNKIVNIESCLRESEKYDGIVLKFKELGEIKLSNIDEIKESPEVAYNKQTDIMAVRNSSENIDYFYISKINNENFGCYAENLIATTNENIFVHEDYDNPESIGYKTFALKTDNCLYCIRLAEIAHESLQLNIYKQLGIKTTKIELKKVQPVIHNKTKE